MLPHLCYNILFTTKPLTTQEFIIIDIETILFMRSIALNTCPNLKVTIIFTLLFSIISLPYHYHIVKRRFHTIEGAFLTYLVEVSLCDFYSLLLFLPDRKSVV